MRRQMRKQFGRHLLVKIRCIWFVPSTDFIEVEPVGVFDRRPQHEAQQFDFSKAPQVTENSEGEQ